MVYSIDNNESVSARLVYDIASGKDGYAAIEDIVYDNTDADATYYDLLGKLVAEPRSGQILIRRTGSRATKLIYQK